jgi:antitoxin component YwqK of YwqJK toxin-antitoxin module
MKILLSLLCLTCIASAVTIPESEKPGTMQLALKPREPNWRAEILKAYPNGNPQTILFFQPLVDGSETPVKQIFFFENSTIQAEMDVTLVDANSPGGLEWKSVVVPNGVRIDFTPKGEVARAATYAQGLIQGECRQFHPNSNVQTVEFYADGKREGKLQIFHEDGKLKEEGYFSAGEPVGEFNQYDAQGKKVASTTYVNGKIHGKAMEWYPNGAIRAQRLFSNGLLHGDGKTPAVIAYDEDKNVREVVDFWEGKAVGANTRYHSNGKDAYRAQYKNGLKIGKELFLSEEGAIIGEGQFIEGKPVGRHWRNHANGQVAYQAEFDQDGNSTSPVREFNENGVCQREFSLVNDKLSGSYAEWYADGTLKIDYYYSAGQFEGEQKEYFPKGQIKASSFYKGGKRDGLHQEWAENGILLQKCSFAEGLKNGAGAEWYSNGTCKIDVNYSGDYPDGLQTEWYENGGLKSRAEYTAGLKNGWQRSWNENGELTFESRFEKDIPTGTMVTWWGGDKIRMRLHFEMEFEKESLRIAMILLKENSWLGIQTAPCKLFNTLRTASRLVNTKISILKPPQINEMKIGWPESSTSMKTELYMELRLHSSKTENHRRSVSMSTVFSTE